MFRALNGLGLGLWHTSVNALAANLALAQRRGEALSVFNIASTVSQGFGPLAGVALAGVAGYPGLFATCIVVGLLGAVIGGSLRGRAGGAFTGGDVP